VPTVKLPSSTPTKLTVTDIRVGSGPKAADGDTLIVRYTGVRSADGKQFDSNFAPGKQPFELVLGSGAVIKGWDQGLVGVQEGGERQLDIPADLAYGATPPNTDVIKPNDALSFVIDVVKVFPNAPKTDQPKVTITPAGNVGKATITELTVGSGDLAPVGTSVALRMVLYRADTGAELTSTWGGPALVFDLGPTSTTYPGFVEAVTGMKVGGRRQVQIPYGSVFNGQGSQRLQLPAGIDIVVVVDLIGFYS
jgi:peptidylprolyl isomerase